MTAELPSIRQQDLRCPTVLCAPPMRRGLVRHGTIRYRPEEKDSFTPLCPDFVVELRSRSDRLSVLQAKMEEYMANGARLGWLLDPLEQRAHIYRPGVQPEILDKPDSLSAEPELPGFTLDLTQIWEPVR